MYVPIFVNSEYSLGFGVSTITQLIERAVAIGLPALALTDMETVSGQMRFHHLAHQLGIKPITGVQIRAERFAHANSLADTAQEQRTFAGKAANRYTEASRSGTRSIDDDVGVLLLARNRSGYEAICKIITAIHLSTQASQASDLIASHAENLFVLTDRPCLIEHFRRANVSTDALRLIIRPGASEARDEPADSRLNCFEPLAIDAHRVKTVAANHVVMSTPDQHDLHELIKAIHQGRAVEETIPSPTQCLLDSSTFESLYSKHPKNIITNTLDLANECNLDLRRVSWIVPDRDNTGTRHSADGKLGVNELESICRSSLEDRLKDHEKLSKEPYYKRLEEELAVVSSLNISDYFLTVATIATEARSLGIPFVARGSAVSSLIVHLLGISAIDPVKHDLYFERFLNLRRVELPDIDLDFPSERRDELIARVFQIFGAERAAMICSYQTFQRKSAWRESLKAYGMRKNDIENFCKRIPLESAPSSETDESKPQHPFATPIQLLAPKFREKRSIIESLIGKPRHISVHPGGVVIADRQITDYVALERAPKGVQVTQYDMASIAKAGLAKIDLLGNRCLSQIDETLTHIKSSSALTANEFINDCRHQIPAADPATLKLINAGRTIGCFQIETPAMRSVLVRMPIKCIADLITALALVRPGPSSGISKNRTIAAYRSAAVNAQDNRESPEQVAPPLFEEDIIRLLADSFKCSLTDADEYRERLLAACNESAVSRMELKKEFLERAKSYSSEKGNEVFAVLEQFVAYSFNKGHATSYAHLAYISAYLKAHFPVEWSCAVLNHYGGAYPLRTLISDFQRCGVNFLPPDINSSQERCTVEPEGVRIGLGFIKHMRQSSVKTILSSRKRIGAFSSVLDLLQRTQLNHNELQGLFMTGACDGLGSYLQWKNYPYIHKALIQNILQDGETAARNFTPPNVVPATEKDAQRIPIFQSLTRIRFELEYLSMHLHNHPMRLLRKAATDCGCISTEEVPLNTGKEVSLGAILAASTRILSKTGRAMQYICLEDEFGTIEAVISPEVFEKMDVPLDHPGPYLAQGKVVCRQDQCTLAITAISPFRHGLSTV